MIKLDGPIVCFDVDDTLIYWDDDKVPKDVYSSISFKFRGRDLKRSIISKHVNELRLQKESGSTIIVWSKSGVEWAKTIIQAIGLEDYVDLVMPKPDRIYDDKDPSEWMPKRRYFS